MIAFTPRLAEPSPSDLNWIHSSKGGNNDCIRIGSSNSVLPNCVGYAWGRFMELLGSKPRLSKGNAEDWYRAGDGYARGSSPKLGAVICWAKGRVGDSSDGAGHVAVVEKINANGSIVTSNSGYSGTRFYVRDLSPPYGMSGYTFQGFIYHPLVDSGTSPVPSSTGCPYAEPSAALKQGNSGEGVRWIQWHLNKNGAGLTIDGSFGPATNTAVRNFQRNYELTIDGIVGPATRYALKAAVAVSATSPTPAPTPTPTPTPAPKPVCPYSEPTAALKQGSSGNGVRWIQWHLNQTGAGLTIDGSFGPATNTAVRNFQSRKGLAVDGSVGPATRAALKSAI